MYLVYNSREELIDEFPTREEAEKCIDLLKDGDEKIPDRFEIREEYEETEDGRYILSAEEINSSRTYPLHVTKGGDNKVIQAYK